MSITTTTDRASYGPGSAITIVTKLTSESLCELDLVPTGPYKCGESVVVDTMSGHQAFPAVGQGEQCGSLPNGVIKPGTVDSATIVWSPGASPTPNQRASANTRYAAVGSWSWDSGRGQLPYEVAADSAPFVISG